MIDDMKRIGISFKFFPQRKYNDNIEVKKLVASNQATWVRAWEDQFSFKRWVSEKSTIIGSTPQPIATIVKNILLIKSTLN